MGPTLFFYQLALVALVWVFFMLYWLLLNAATGLRQPILPFTTPRRPRSKEPKPFAGLTQKPHCALCDQAIQAPQAPPLLPPEPLPLTNRRPRTVDTSMQFCPHEGCRYRGWLGLGNLRANGHPSGSPWRQFHCISCHGYFFEHHGTIFHGKRTEVERIVRVLACLSEGLGIRATARVFDVDPNTVLQWLGEAAEHLQAFSAYCLCDFHVNQVQLDELYAVLSVVKDGEISEVKAIQRLSRSPHWLWVAIDPVTKLVLTLEVGEHTLAMAQCVVHRVAQLLAPDCIPLFLTDGLKDYLTAILAHFGYWVQPPRHRTTGPQPKPRWMPLPTLLYAQVIKTSRRRYLVRISRRVVFGTLEAVDKVLAAHGWQINTAFIEVRPVGRKEASVSG